MNRIKDMLAGRDLESEIFWDKVNKTESCWEWTGCFDANGYGRTEWNGKQAQSHRVAAYLSGMIPQLKKQVGKGLADCVLHHCDNRACCRPTHLFIGSRKENSKDMVAKGRDNFWGKSRKK